MKLRARNLLLRGESLYRHPNPVKTSTVAGVFLIAVLLYPLPASSSSKISTKNSQYDFGRVAEGEVVKHSFEFVNAGDDTLAVYDVQKSCGCSRASVSNTTLAPGETAWVNVEFHTGGYRGETSKYVNLFTSDPKNSQTRFTLKGAVQSTPKMVDTAAPAATRTRITILHTTDVHGQIYPTTYKGVPDQGGWAKLSTLIKRIRDQDPELILLDGGDAIQGSSMAFYTAGEGAVRVMNHLKYNAMALGNHEFDVGQQELAKRFVQAQFPILSANVEVDTAVSSLPIQKPYLVLNAKGKRIGVLGLTPESTPRYLSMRQWRGVRFKNMEEAARKYVPILRSKEKVDAVIVLVHGGYSKGEGVLIEPVRRIAEQMEGIDVIIMGHSHDHVPEMRVKNTAGQEVLLTQAFRWGIVLGRVDLVFRENDVVEKRGMTIPVGTEIEPDAEVKALVADVKEKVDRTLSVIVGKASMKISNPYRYYEEGPLTHLTLEALRHAAKTDIALFGWDNMPRGLDEGDITVGELYSLFPYDDEIEVIRMTGAELKKVLEAGAEELGAFRDWNFVAAAGVNYVLDPSAPIGLRIQNLSYRGKPISAARTFEVAVNSFQAAGAAKGRMNDMPRVRTLEMGFRDALIEYVKSQKTIEPKTAGWWTVRESPAALKSSGGQKTEEKAVASAPRPIDINLATADELDAVPYVGRRLAEKIVAARLRRGRFENMQDLLSIQGMGRRKLELLSPYLVVHPANAASLAGADPR